ncbi:unnamed protein product [Zymoseptoria tritici ST99CH_1E4]|uniref:Uncharacterized protein n=1 Tax=Zymoseptoria tritici ST99CH_1E4 TaxID=1276532 RepID=A0A2H1FLK1_ZYMTR|nr:unnamed protein product [Zymoseptoria tritici ST99CH_1E4]
MGRKFRQKKVTDPSRPRLLPALKPIKRSRPEEDEGGGGSYDFMGTGGADDDDDNDDERTLADFNPEDLAAHVASVNIDRDEGDLPVVERGLTGHVELQEIIAYQEPFFDPSDDDEPSGDLPPDEDKEEVGDIDTPIEDEAQQQQQQSSMLPLPPPGQAQLSVDASTSVVHRRMPTAILDTKLALGIWATSVGISRPEYQNLLAILNMTDDLSALRNLPGTVDTLKKHAKETFPLLDLRMQKIALNLRKRQSLSAGNKNRAAAAAGTD